MHSIRVDAEAWSVRLAVVELLRRRRRGLGSTEALQHDLGGEAGTWPAGELARDHPGPLATAGPFEVDLFQWVRLRGPERPAAGAPAARCVGLWVSGDCAVFEVEGRAAGLWLLVAAATRAADAFNALEVTP